jgi:hypothetical protein
MKQNIFLISLLGIFQFVFNENAHADVLDNWTTHVIAINSDAVDSITYGNGCYVATAEYFDSGSIYSSVDGVNWTLQNHNLSTWGTSLNFVNGRFVGVGGYGTVSISADGTNWIVSGVPTGYSDYFGDITYGNGLYVKVGSTNGVGSIYTSTNGSAWTSRLSSNPLTGAKGYISSVTYGLISQTQPWFLAIGDNDGYFYTSPNGISWTRRNIIDGSVVSFGNGLFIVPLNNNSNLVSSDGINWSLLNTGLTNQLGRVIWSSGLFMAFSGSCLATSTDGTNWFQYSNKIPNGGTRYGFIAGYYQNFATDGKQLITFSNVSGSVYPPVSNNAIAYLSGPLVDIRITNNIPKKLALSGLVGRNYQIQSVNMLVASNSWQTNVILQLTNTPFDWTDSAATNSARFYRGVLLP